MKKQLLTIATFATICLTTNAQQVTEPKMIPCNTFNAMEELFANDLDAKMRYQTAQAQLELEYEQAMLNFNAQKTSAPPTYTIPVVFHVMGTGHSAGTSGISDQVFKNLIGYLNNDFAKLGNDVASINPSFAGLYVDSEIRFALALKDPTGKCTNGIIRHPNDSKFWNQASPNYAYSGNGTNRWPTTKYLNIYIVDCIQSSTSACPQTGSYVAGYTYLPGSFSAGAPNDAIVLLSYNGALAQSNPNNSRTISHEIGHWLNLLHTFGNTNNPYFQSFPAPTTPANCTTDNVADTPPTGGYFGICPTTQPLDCSTPNTENIMDYSSCPKMFTQGQITRMRTSLTSSVAGRNNLWSSTNLDAAGITGGYTCTPLANFIENKKTVCNGQIVTYTSTSQLGVSGSIAWTFEGGTPATSTATLQAVTYSSAGTYSVSLLATNTTSTNTLTKISYITVNSGASGLSAPFTENFEAAALPSNFNVINNNAGSVGWEQNNSVGATGTAKSAYLNNASLTNSSAHIDILETPYYNFSNITNTSLSYNYAYARKIATQVDSFRVQYSLDCGGTWVTPLTGALSSAVMSSNSGGTSANAFVPTAAQWKTATIPFTSLAVLSNKPSVKFRFYYRCDAIAGSANNLYIDQINLTGTVGLNELENTIGLIIYPNPTNTSATVNFKANETDKIKLTVYDITGRVLEELTKPETIAGSVTYTVNKNNTLAKGIYLVSLTVNNKQLTKKLIIE